MIKREPITVENIYERREELGIVLCGDVSLSDCCGTNCRDCPAVDYKGLRIPVEWKKFYVELALDPNHE